MPCCTTPHIASRRSLMTFIRREPGEPALGDGAEVRGDERVLGRRRRARCSWRSCRGRTSGRSSPHTPSRAARRGHPRPRRVGVGSSRKLAFSRSLWQGTAGSGLARERGLDPVRRLLGPFVGVGDADAAPRRYGRTPRGPGNSRRRRRSAASRGTRASASRDRVQRVGLADLVELDRGPGNEAGDEVSLGLEERVRPRARSRARPPARWRRARRSGRCRAGACPCRRAAARTSRRAGRRRRRPRRGSCGW